jgi:dTDP-4-dehydrorhamnose reductase
MKKVLVVGASSDIAKEYILRLNKNYRLWQTTRTGKLGFKVDLAKPELLSAELINQTYDVIVVFAAMTKFVDCEANPTLAKMINCDSLIYLHNHLNAKHWIVISTNSVFSGDSQITLPDEKYAPFNQYGHSKVKMEEYFGDHKSQVSIVRLTKVLTPKFTFFKEAIVKLRLGERVSVFDDMVFSPLSLSQVANYLVQLTNKPSGGVHQLSGLQDVSYFEALNYLVSQIGLSNQLIIPISKTVLSPKHTCLFVNQRSLDLGFVPKPYTQIFGEQLGHLQL